MQAQTQQQDAAAQQANLDSKIQAAANDRIKLQDSARAILPENYTFDGKSNRQIQTDALEVLGVKLSTDASDVAVSAAYETAAVLAKNTTNTDSRQASPARQLLQQIGESGRTDGRGQVEYVPPHKRADSAQTVDAMEELDRMNAHYNNPRNYAGAAGGK